MKLVHRSENVISQKHDLVLLHSMKKFPVFVGCVEHDPKEDLLVDMDWMIFNHGLKVELCCDSKKMFRKDGGFEL